MPFRCRKCPCSCFTIHDKKFQRVVHIKESGVIIYRQISLTKNEVGSRSNTTPDSFILQNTTSKDIFIADVMPYFDYYKIYCPRCKHIIEKSKTLLSNISQINKNDVIGICDHCRWKYSKESCQSCKKIAEQFITVKDNYKDDADEPYELTTRMSKINKFMKDTTVGEKQVNKETDRTFSTHEPKLGDLYLDTNSKLLRSSYSLPDISKLRKARFVDHISLISNSDKFLHLRSENDLKHCTENSSRASEETMRHDLNYDEYIRSITRDRDVNTYVTEDEFGSRKQPSDFNYRDPQRDYFLNHKNPRRGLDFSFSKSKNDLYDNKQLGVTPVKKYTSDNALSSSISAVIQDIAKNDCTYYFPKVKKRKNKSVTEISSSELIKDTQVMLETRSERERIRLEHEHHIKQEEMEKKIKANKSDFTFQETENKSRKKRETETFKIKTTEINKYETKGKTFPNPDKKVDEITQTIKPVKNYHTESKDVKELNRKEFKYEKNKKQINLNESKKENVYKLEKRDHTIKKDSKQLHKIGNSPTEPDIHGKNEELATKKVIKKSNVKSGSEDSEEPKKSKSKSQYKNKDLKEYDDVQNTSNALNKFSKEKQTKDRQMDNKVILPLIPESQPEAKTQYKQKDLKEYDDVQNTPNTINKMRRKEQTKDSKIVNEDKNISPLKSDSRSYKDRKSEDKVNIPKAKETKVTGSSKENTESENKISAKSGEKEPERGKGDKYAEDEFKKQLLEQAKLKEIEQKQKKIREEEERKARQVAERKTVELPEIRPKTPAGQEKTTSPVIESKSGQRQEIPTTKDLNIAQVKLRKPSIDDTILHLVKIKEGNRIIDMKKVLSDKNVKSLILRHKGHSLRNADCLICNDSNIELALDSLDREGEVDSNISDIIIGNKIFKHKPPLTEQNKEPRNLPILFESLYKDELADGGKNNEVLLEITEDFDNKLDFFDKRGDKTVEQEVPKGIIRYALSDRSFIEKGWTMLPTEKVVRKMNVYRMRPAHPEFDWFEHNKTRRLMQYDSGEKLAEFDDNGRGRWFYKNGRVALDYYDAEETNAQQRFVVYSSGEPDKRGRSRPFTILATFDYLGNGIVFDHVGKIRLKYNQTEGVLLDRSLGPVSHWKWHALNDPPVLQQVMIDTQMAHKDPDIIKLGGSNELKKRPDNEEMLAIEFDNFIKEKRKKLTQTFKPFQIKMKALKINEQFSLKVLDQATIYLIFREGSANLKLNLGMILDHKEIVDTDTAEVGEVSSNLERLPACTDSIAELQSSLARAQFAEKLRVERDKRIRPTLPCASVDRLVAASSRPLRPPLRTAESTSATTVSCACKYRKPSYNLYYDTRIL